MESSQLRQIAAPHIGRSERFSIAHVVCQNMKGKPVAFTHNQAPTHCKTRVSLVLIATFTLSGLAFGTTSQEYVPPLSSRFRLLWRQSCFSLVSDFARLSVPAVCMHEKRR